MDKVWGAVGGFFRVFDVAFFLPGAVVLIGIVFSNHDWWRCVRTQVLCAVAPVKYQPENPNWLGPLVLALTTIILVYLAGLLCHALARLTRAVVKQYAANSIQEIYKGLLKTLFDVNLKQAAGTVTGKGVSERALYLWNLAALSWNLAVAFVAVAIIWLTAPCFDHWALLLFPVGAAGLLTLLGSEFRYYSERMDKQSGSG